MSKKTDAVLEENTPIVITVHQGVDNPKNGEDNEIESLEHLYTALKHRVLENKLDGKTLKLACFEDGYRSNKSLLFFSGFEGDVDNKIPVEGKNDPSGYLKHKPAKNPLTPDAVTKKLTKLGIGHIIVSSYSHRYKEFKKQDGSVVYLDIPSFRVFILYDYRLEPKYYDAAFLYIHRELFDSHDGIDKIKVMSQVFLAPSCPPGREDDVVSICKPGKPLKIAPILEEYELLEREKPKKKFSRAHRRRFEKSLAKVNRWAEHHEVEINNIKEEDGRVILEVYCIYGEHDNPYKAYIIIFDSGAIKYGCHSTSCKGNDVKWGKVLEDFPMPEDPDSVCDEVKKSATRENLEKRFNRILDRLPTPIPRDKVLAALRPLQCAIAANVDGFGDFVGELTLEEIQDLSPESGSEELEALQQQLEVLSELKHIDYEGGIGIKKTVTEKKKDGSSETKVIVEKITNFQAHASSDISIALGDGEVTRQVGLVGTGPSQKPLPEIKMEAARFNKTDWPMEHWGANIIVAENVSPAQLREAMQARGRAFSPTGEIPSIRYFGHTGYTVVDGERMYLSPGLAITAEGFRVDIVVDLLKPLLNEYYRLVPPASGGKLKQIIRMTLKFRNLGPRHITVPLFASYTLSVLCEFHQPTSSIFSSGGTGIQKSALMALLMCFCGAGFDFDTLPASFDSSPTYLEGVRFALKDNLFLIDEATAGSKPKEQIMREKDRFFRTHANKSERGRGTQKGNVSAVSKPSRSMIGGNGESLEGLASLIARLWPIEFYKGCIDLDKLSKMQALIKLEDKPYVQGHAAYIQRNVQHFDTLRTEIPKRFLQCRNMHMDLASIHSRVPSNIAELLIGLREYYTFALEVGAISASEREEMLREDQKTLIKAAKNSANLHNVANPVERFLRTLFEWFSSGKAHLTSSDPENLLPSDPLRWGYRKDGGAYRGQGICLGSVHESRLEVHLIPETAFAELQKYSNTAIHIGSEALWGMFRDQGLTECEKGRNQIKRTTPTGRHYVLCLKLPAVEKLLGIDRDDIAEQKRKDAASKPNNIKLFSK